MTGLLRIQDTSVATRKISVIIPVYNAERYISETIESVLNQTGCELEIIVVDDGSTDTTQQVVALFGDRVRYLQQQNAGPAAARNLGVSVARHDWIAFLDADDLWAPDKLQRQLEMAESTGASVVYTNTRNFGDLNCVAELRMSPQNMPAGDVFAALLMDNFMTLSSVTIRKDAFLQAGGFRERYFGTEDWDLWLRLAASGVRFAAVPEALTLYRWHSTSLSKNHRRMKMLREETLRAALAAPGTHTVTVGLRRRAVANMLATSAWFIEQAEPGQALGWYLSALLQWPLKLQVWKSMVKVVLRLISGFCSEPVAIAAQPEVAGGAAI
ncbi:MAG: glycosyltransferase family A protein [Fuerstiella sp.]